MIQIGAGFALMGAGIALVAALGIQNAANSLGQAGGPLLGGLLFIWHFNAPYLFSGAALLALAWLLRGTQSTRAATPACGRNLSHAHYQPGRIGAWAAVAR